MAAARFYSSIAGVMELQNPISAADVSMVVDLTTGLPGTTPFTLVVDVGAATEEIVTVTGVAGTTLTITRGADGSSAQSHAAGAQIRHMATARDFREPQEHIGASSGVHGVTGSVVGTTDTQTLTHKDLTDATNTFPASLATDAELAAHTGATVAHGASGAVVGTTNIQTLTNKTIDGSSNTLSNIPESAVTNLTTDLSGHGTRLTAIETNLGSQTTFAATSAAKDGKQLHWGAYTVTLDASGYATVTHGAGFTPTVVVPCASVTTFVSTQADMILTVDSFGATTFRIRGVKSETGAVATGSISFTAFLGE